MMIDTLMVTDRDKEWQELSDARAKRRRGQLQNNSRHLQDCTNLASSPSSYYGNNSSMQTNSPTRDCFTEVLEGHVNGVIRSSWMNEVRQIQRRSYVADNTAENLRDSLKALSLQLIQLKRRLWPASERCAHGCGMSPFDQYEEARRICNPMEPLGEGNHQGLNQMFMNRSAIKLANIDAMLNFSLSRAVHDSTQEPFLFADLCGAPGGFSEYLMKRCQTSCEAGSCRGYGMSLVGSNGHGDGTLWKLDNMCTSYGNFLTNFTVSGGADGTGDLYRWANVNAFSSEIQNDLRSAGLSTSKGMHLVVADGGFAAQRNSECQEEIAQKLVVCQVAAGLHLLRPGGSLIVKMFGFQTPTVRSAMRCLYDSFDDILVVKPISSRPASAERYVVCTGFHGLPTGWSGEDWMSKALLCQSTNQDAHYWSLDRYLDDFDRDMLALNVRSCFAILSYLDGKSSSWHQGPWDGPKVNVDAYKQAWRLE